MQLASELKTCATFGIIKSLLHVQTIMLLTDVHDPTLSLCYFDVWLAAVSRLIV